MYDSEGKASSDIAVSMSQDKKTVEVTYTPSADWLNSEDRVYPVTIDPDVYSSQLTSNITDFSCYCCFEFDSINFSNPTLWMGMDYNVYIRFGSVATLPEGTNYLGSYLTFCGDNMNDLTECSMAVSYITQDWYTYSELLFNAVYEDGEYEVSFWFPTVVTKTEYSNKTILENIVGQDYSSN